MRTAPLVSVEGGGGGGWVVGGEGWWWRQRDVLVSINNLMGNKEWTGYVKRFEG